MALRGAGFPYVYACPAEDAYWIGSPWPELSPEEFFEAASTLFYERIYGALWFSESLIDADAYERDRDRDFVAVILDLWEGGAEYASTILVIRALTDNALGIPPYEA